MAEFDENEFDEGLRRIAEGQGVEPSPALWNGIRMAALERQLISYQSAALWFKGIIGVLTVLLGMTGLLLYKAGKEPNDQIAQEIVPAKIDTVYVTRTERVFTDRPVVVYVEKKSFGGQPKPLNLDQAHTVDAQNAAAANLTLENSKTKAEPNSQSDEGIRSSPVDQKPDSKEVSVPALTGSPEEGSKTSALKDGTSAREKVLFENRKEERLGLDVSRLNALAQKPGHPFKLPKIPYQKPTQAQAAAVAPKVAKIRTPFPQRLSLSAYVSPDWNKLDVRRDEPGAFKYGDEELQAGILAGVRVGQKLSDKWSLLAGAEFSRSSFDDGKRRQVLAAERVNGQTGFPYRTALGTVLIPADLLSSPPAANDRIGLEVHEPILRYALNLPLALRYDIWRKRFLLLNQVPLRFAAYGLLGGYAQIPLRQEGKVNVFEESGREFEAELTGFRNLRPAYGLSLGVGAELGVGKHLSIFTEPTYVQGLSSVVKDMPIRTTIRGFGVKLGAKWGFGKK